MLRSWFNQRKIPADFDVSFARLHAVADGGWPIASKTYFSQDVRGKGVYLMNPDSRD